MLNYDPNVENPLPSDLKRLYRMLALDSDERGRWPARPEVPPTLPCYFPGGRGHGEQVCEACSIKETFHAWEVKGPHQSRSLGLDVLTQSQAVVRVAAFGSALTQEADLDLSYSWVCFPADYMVLDFGET